MRASAGEKRIPKLCFGAESEIAPAGIPRVLRCCEGVVPPNERLYKILLKGIVQGEYFHKDKHIFSETGQVHPSPFAFQHASEIQYALFITYVTDGEK